MPLVWALNLSSVHGPRQMPSERDKWGVRTIFLFSLLTKHLTWTCAPELSQRFTLLMAFHVYQAWHIEEREDKSGLAPNNQIWHRRCYRHSHSLRHLPPAGQTHQWNHSLLHWLWGKFCVQLHPYLHLHIQEESKHKARGRIWLGSCSKLPLTRAAIKSVPLVGPKRKPRSPTHIHDCNTCKLSTTAPCIQKIGLWWQS